jgi:CubicO group peptidase (beta-lactamase class C family)
MSMRASISALLVLGGLGTLSLGSIAACAADSASRQRQVENQVPPELLVDGEPAHFPTLQQRMAQLQVPGVSIAVVHEGRIDWARGYGVAWAGGPAVTADTLFQAASISKPVTALAVLRLADSRTIDLDREANDYLKSWKIPDTPFTVKSKVTVAELLRHTAGINLGGFPGYTAGQPLPTLLQILEGTPPAFGPAITVTSVPGTQWRYAGGGYVILRQLLTDVTGKPFELLMRDSVLVPLGMTHSTFQQPLPAQLATAAARPHDVHGRGFDHGARIYPEQAPDGLWTTASDLARYLLAVQKSRQQDGLLSAAMTRRMLMPNRYHWGLGPIIGQDARHPYFMFSGGNYGFISVFVAYRDGDGVVVLTNGEQGGTLAADVVRSTARAYHWPDFQPISGHSVALAPDAVPGLVGVYRAAGGDTVVITREHDVLSLVQIGNRAGPQRLYPQSRDRFLVGATATENYPESAALEAVFSRGTGDSARTLKLILDGSHVMMTATRLNVAEEQQVLERLAQVTLRYQKQLPAPGGAQALRRLIAAMAQGQPEAAHVAPGFAEVIRTDRIPNARIFSALGAVVAIAYDGTSPGGSDAYRVQFAHGDCFIHLQMNPDGEIQDLDLRVN